MSTPRPRRASLALFFVFGYALSSLTAHSQQESPRLGTPLGESDLQGFDLVVAPDGEGLPPGNGTARQGRQLFNDRCAACHGMSGEGVSTNTIIVGGDMRSPEAPLRTVGSYWPHASTLFDFVRRAMPADAPKSLSNIEVYQVVAYVLYLNELVAEDAVINADTLIAIRMPNADGFTDLSDIH